MGLGGEASAEKCCCQCVSPRDCLRGCLLEDHSGGYRIEIIRPDSVLVTKRPGEVRGVEVRPERFTPSRSD